MKKDSMSMKAVNIVLSVLIALSFILSALSVLYISVFTNKEVIIKKCLVDSYYESVYTSAKNALTTATKSVVAIDTDKLIAILDESKVKELAKDYMTACVTCVVDNTGAPEVSAYESDEMRNIVITGISESAENNGFQISDEQLQTDGEAAYKLLTGYVDASIRFLPSIVSNILVRIGGLVAKTAFLNKMPALFTALLVVLLLIKVIINRKTGVANILYKTASPLWIGAITIFIPFAVLSFYNLPSKIAVDPSSSLYFFLVGIINSIIHNGFVIMLITTLILTAYLAVSIVMISRHPVRSRRISHYVDTKEREKEKIAQ